MNDERIQTPQDEEAEFSEHARVRREKLAALKADGRDPYTITSYPVDAYANDIREKFEVMDGKEVHIAGRMMSRRIMGKASFLDLRDGTDRMQVYVKRDDVGEDVYADFKKWDIGDIIGVKGEPKTPEEMEQILAERRAKWKPRAPRYRKGVLRLFSMLAASPMKGAYLDYGEEEDR